MPLALAVLACVWAAMLLLGASAIDREGLALLHAGGAPALAEGARWATRLGDGGVLIAATTLGVGLLLYRRAWRPAALLAGITLSGRLLVELQKAMTARLRPDAPGQLIPVETLAFPSGHAANAAMVWLCLALLLPTTARGRAWALSGAAVLALAAGASRIMLGVHWPSDVVGGWAFGLFWALLLLRLAGEPPDHGNGRAAGSF